MSKGYFHWKIYLNRNSRQILFLMALMLSFLLHAQSYWMQKAGSVSVDEGYGISLDDSNNTYTTGYFTGTGAFGKFTLTTIGVTDIFITKTDKNGVFKWAEKAGDGGADRGLAIKTDAQGNSYITGYYYGTALFGKDTLVSVGLQDVFIAKYDRNGHLKWAVSAGGKQADMGNAITIDNNGNIFVTGQFIDSASFGSFKLAGSPNQINVFTAKLDSSNGNFLWAKAGTGPHTDKGLGVACDPAGNVYVSGQYSDTITFDYTSYTDIYGAIFLVKYNNAGQEQWFTYAGGGTYNIANAITTDKNYNVYLTGDFQGSLNFFAKSFITLTNKYANCIFIAKYDSGANLIWDVADGSSNAVTSRDIALDSAGNPYIIGNFECIMNGYADQYGQGTFNSVGYWDIFTSEYAASKGGWQWSRQIGGQGNNYGWGLAVGSDSSIFTTGSFDQDVLITTGAGFIPYLANNGTFCNGAYCSDSYYSSFGQLNTYGNLDIFIAKPFDLTRQPYDFYIRSGNVCNRPMEGVCINTSGTYGLCQDTVQFCGSGTLYAITNACNYISPNYNFLWSNSEPLTSIVVSATGWYAVTITSVDGCFTSRDSIYVIINPIPPSPTLSDNVVINVNSQNPSPILLCGRTCLLWGGNYDSSSFYWSVNSNALTDTIMITKNGKYCFNIKDSMGCKNSTCVSVTVDSLIHPIIPKLKCITCTNDTVSFCRGGSFVMFAYDSITNPLGNAAFSIPPPIYTSNNWEAKPNTISYLRIAQSDFNTFFPSDSGWYLIKDSIVRENQCDTLLSHASDSVFVKLYPNPPPIILSINGVSTLCKSDSTWLVESGYSPFVWSTGSTKDSIFVGIGSYSVSATVTNSYGCNTNGSAYFTIFSTTLIQPRITIYPSDGVVCPNDSVLLVCGSEKYQQFQWYGPLGKFGGNDSAVFVKIPGNYFCYVSDSAPCALSALSNTITVELYSTPFLSLSPGGYVCNGDSVKLTAIASNGANIQWLPPLKGDSNIQYVNTSGVYSCKIVSCGITTVCTSTVNVASPLATIHGTPVLCANGDSVILSADSGLLYYNWLPGNINTPFITVKSVGTHTLSTIDSYGCQASATVSVIEPPFIGESFISAFNVLCYGGSSGKLTIGVSGGTPAYTYLWTPSGGNNATATGLETGNYTVMVNDKYGCAFIAIDSLTQPPIMNLSIPAFADVSCNGGSNGSASVAVTGGVPNYIYSWSPGGQTANSITGLKIGTYTVSVTDSDGCIMTDSVTLTSPTTLITTLNSIPTNCINNNGDANATSIGGTAPYNYLWQPGNNTNSNYTGLSSGTYTTLVTDANGCINTLTVNVGYINTLTVTIAGTDSACKGQSTSLFASGATSYSWSTGSIDTGIIVIPLFDTTYWVKGTEGPCSDTSRHTISMYPPLSGFISVPDTICPGKAANLLETVYGGKHVYTYSWNNNISYDSAGPITVNPEESSVYIVNVNDACNTVITDTTYVDVINLLHLSFHASPDTVLSGEPVNFINTSQNGISYNWTFGDGTVSSEESPVHSYSQTGIYVVYLIADNSLGCPDSTAENVVVTNKLIIPNVFTPNGDGINDKFYFTLVDAHCFDCKIYNRWGTLVYELRSPYEGWNGTVQQSGGEAPDGVYYYILSYCDYNGIHYGKDGYLQLIRN